MYKDTILQKYIDLITSKMPGVFKGVYMGDPLRLPKSNIPALILSRSQTRVGPLTNAEDQHEMTLVLTVVTDMRDEINDDQTIVPGVAQLYDLVEGRNNQYKLKDNSILNILRANIEVDTALNLRTDLGSLTRIDYGLTIGKRGMDSYAVECNVEFVATYSQLRK